MSAPKDQVGYLDNALNYRARAPKQPLKGTLRAFFLGGDSGTPNFDTLTPTFLHLFFEGTYNFESFEMKGLATYRAVTREQDPPSLRGALLYTRAPSLFRCAES